MSIASEEEWAERAAAFLKHKLRECEVTYAELAKRLKKHGFKAETEASITNKLKRGTFPAHMVSSRAGSIGFGWRGTRGDLILHWPVTAGSGGGPPGMPPCPLTARILLFPRRSTSPNVRI